ncbi:unnamed protein product [Caenorhabditis auriculariae]|uniref:MAD homolog n=1 Tax=Caenorhabditis auriculariae TaxID=2777116 RepID=A0A8S1GXW1_9PELO|nr:unnamed protein product [Caenorhabditis auriculariae]
MTTFLEERSRGLNSFCVRLRSGLLLVVERNEMNGLLHMHAPAVKKLLGWKIGDDEEKWAERAIEALVKKLKKKKSACGSLEDLEFALANPGIPSRCVTIPKSLDGRLQVSHKKGLPHVIYCRVWRWPDVVSHQELRAIPECSFPYETSSKTQHICINPYHYQRVQRLTQSPFLPSYAASSPQSIPSPHASGAWASSSVSRATSCASSPSPSLFSEDGDAAPSTKNCSIISPNCWATISYYELNTRVGELFKLNNRCVTVDGYTDPSNCDHRICLGQITNVNRNSTIENTRKHIGRGLRLELMDNNNVFVVNLSDAPIFIQSRNANIAINQAPTKVCRVPPQHTMCVFDFNLFYQMLDRTQNGELSELHDLNKMCFIRISFVKGWGDDYPRQDVTSTPCWLELRLHVPLAWIDQTLPQARMPENEPTSVS